MSARAPSPNAAPQFRRLCIFGAGGSGRETAWLAREVWGDRMEMFFTVDSGRHLSDPVAGIPVVLLSDIDDTSQTCFVAAVGDARLRRTAVALCEEAGMTAVSIVHPRAEMSGKVNLNPGVIVCAGAVVTTDVAIGAHVQVNIGCTISHDVIIGEYSTLSPGCHISGHVHMGRNVFVGTGANVINGSPEAPLIIGDNAVIAAGACVTGHVEAGTMVAGVPAVRKR